MKQDLQQTDFEASASWASDGAPEDDTPAPVAQLRLEPAPIDSGSYGAGQELSTTKSSLLDRAYTDYCQRREAGEDLNPESYCAQFPSMQSSLGRLLRVHFFLEENSVLLADAPECRWPEVGEVFLDYRLKLELGKGAFARVFLAEETKVGNRLVAVKVALHGAFEADVLGRIKHPNIVPIHSVHEDAATGLTAVCMPYAGCATLEDVLDKAFTPALGGNSASSLLQARTILDAAGELSCPLDPSGILNSPASVLRHGTYLDGIRLIGAQLADALAYLHTKGISHRDLKPSNVLLSPEGVPMLLDFNLCADAKNLPNRLGGTMPYMSPEQLRATDMGELAGEAILDARSDLFSLGVILYQLVTGAHPFGPVPLNLTSPDLRRYLLERQAKGPAEARRLNPNVDSSFSQLIQRCLAHDPKDRPATAGQIALALRRQLAPVPMTKRWISRHPRKVLAATLLVAFLGSLGGVLAATRPPYSERQLDSGFTLYQQGQYGKAVSHFNDALQADPSNSAALSARGQAHQQLGNFDLALQDYQEADKRNPDGRIKAALAYCLNRTGNDQAAGEYYRRAIELGFATPEVLNNQAYCLLKSNHFQEARTNLDRAVALKSGLQSAYHNRALVAYKSLLPRKKQLEPTAKRKEIYRVLESGIADVEEAIRLGIPSAELYSDAAFLCALAARVDPRWVPVAVRHLERAVDEGLEPTKCADPVLAVLQGDPAFVKLANRLGTGRVLPPSRRILNPVEDLLR